MLRPGMRDTCPFNLRGGRSGWKQRLHAPFWPLATLCIFLLYLLGRPECPKPCHAEPLVVCPPQASQEQALVQACHRARHSLYAAVMDASSEPLLSALLAAHHRGVAVELVSAEKPKGWPTTLWRQGVSPKGGLFHPKCLLVDAQEVWIGSANYHTHAFHEQANLLLGFDHPTLAAYIASQLPTPAPHASPLQAALGEGSLQCMVLPNKRGHPLLLEQIRRATQTLDVALFVLTEPQILSALADAVRRGVAVRLLLHRSAPQQMKQRCAELLAGGAAVRVWDGPALLHHKFAWIDQSTLCCGSVNWTRSGWRRNTELFVILQGLPLPAGQSLQQVWDWTWSQSRPLIDLATPLILQLVTAHSPPAEHT